MFDKFETNNYLETHWERESMKSINSARVTGLYSILLSKSRLISLLHRSQRKLNVFEDTRNQTLHFSSMTLIP